jgi:pyridoxal 5'-phosphate synthase pdxT subunit
VNDAQRVKNALAMNETNPSKEARAPVNEVRVGILCLQGDYEAHGHVLERLCVPWRDVRRPSDLDGLHGLILPGGESTTMWHFLRQGGFDAAVQEFARAGGALYGTCAGAILMAREVRNPAGRGLGLLDAVIERNAYGRQIDSSVRQALLDDVTGLGNGSKSGQPLDAILIRAPRFLELGATIRVRARLEGDPAWVEQGRIMATTFHPELGTEERPHRRFLELVASGR